MTNMRDLMETVMLAEKGGKSGRTYRDTEHGSGEGGGMIVPLDQILDQVAQGLGWKNRVSNSEYNMLWQGYGKVGMAYPRNFTKSDIQFVLYAVNHWTLVLACKCGGTSWASREEPNEDKKDSTGVTYHRMQLIDGWFIPDLVKDVKDFTQRYKRNNAGTRGTVNPNN